MAKRFRLRLARVIPSFQFCRSKSPCVDPVTRSPALHLLSPVNPKAVDIGYPNIPAPPPSTPHHPSFKRPVSSKIVSFGCDCKSRSSTLLYASDCEYSPDLRWKRDGQWHVVDRDRDGDDGHRRKIYSPSLSGCSGESRVSPRRAEKKLRKQRNRKKKGKASIRTSTSSADSGWFSSEVENEVEETEALVSSSRSFTTDSSYDFGNSLETVIERPIKRKKKKNSVKKVRRLKRYVSKSWKRTAATFETAKTMSSSPESPVRLSVFQRLMPCTVDGKVRESFAVVKRSEDPKADFKNSMLEMILEKQMFDAEDLEQLLQCFLTLNSRHHHWVIVKAFSEIWEALFCQSPDAQGIPVHV